MLINRIKKSIFENKSLDGNKNFKKGCFNENIRRELITD